ncbi:hypothetical protein K0504_03775 [Neiella marina]|uniref:Uncharacterized protein n=1 Tax=Neiella holothuriorum TaxID=2870530 RepID=A0ABS7ED36_9GAMM|nr:hypothetical protein [Neiella holothuriorum]MBW8190145.1 hypothetical protein [Neiella holothuriorum]
MSGFIEFLGYFNGKKVSQVSAANGSHVSAPSTKGRYFRYTTERTDD